MILVRATCIAVDADWLAEAERIANRAAAFVKTDKPCVMAFARRSTAIRTIAALAIDRAAPTIFASKVTARVVAARRRSIATMFVST